MTLFPFFSQCIAIDDVNPQAPTHFLVIPKKPIAQLSTSSDEDEQVSNAPRKWFIEHTHAIA